MNSKERIDHLRQYLVGCLKAGLLTKEDLVSGEVLHKLLAVISRDMRVVGREFAVEGLGGLARLGVMKLAQFAESLGKNGSK